MTHYSSPDSDPDASSLASWFVLASECLGGVALIVVVGFLLHVFLGG